MPMTREQEHVLRDLNSRLSRLFVQGINRQPDETITQVISRIQEALKAQEKADPRKDLRAWGEPLRKVVDYLGDSL
jgi:hypothetical protein